MVMTLAQNRFKRRPEGSNWGDFGPDDELGRLNFITPDAVRRAVGEVTEGISFCLSLPLDLPGSGDEGSARHPPRLAPSGAGEHAQMNRPAESERWPGVTDYICDDVVTMALQYSTQWDSLCHHGYAFDADGDGVEEVVYYNGFRPDELFRKPSEEPGKGVRHLGVENMAAKAVQSRGVMFDFHRHYGPGRRALSYEDVMRVIDADKIDLQKGDIICAHTGYAQTILEMAGKPDQKVLRTLGAEFDGLDKKLLQWIDDSGIVAIASDTVAVETFRRPTGEGPRHALMPLHEHCLFKLGIPLGEYWHFTPLAKALAERKRTGFLLTAPPLRLPGAVGSPVTPVATI
jgi:kynurenine formamidase